MVTPKGTEPNFRPPTATDYVREELRRRIFDGRVPEDGRIIQSDLARQLGVSTTPVRDAVRDLVSEGILKADDYRSAVVRVPSHSEIEELYEIRMMLESRAIIKAVPNLSGGDLDLAESIMQNMVPEQDIGRYIQLNEEFHNALFIAANAPRLLDFISLARSATTLPLAIALRSAHGHDFSQQHDEHRQLLEACRRGDTERAAELTRDHLRSTPAANPGARMG